MSESSCITGENRGSSSSWSTGPASISIALATWNAGSYLRQQLRSFLNQTRQPDELIICDDASDDDTVQIARSVLSEARFRITITSNPQRLGVAENFSRALGHCRGDVVALSDQDDVWLPHKLERIETEFRCRQNLGVLINDAILTDASLTSTGRTRIEQIRKGRYPTSHFVQGSCTSLRGGLLQHLLPVPSHVWTHDSWIHAVGWLLDVRAILYEPLQYFRRHGSNESDSPTSSLAPLSTRRILAGKFRRNIVQPQSRRATIGRDLAKEQSLLSWWDENAVQLVRLPYVDAVLARKNADSLRHKLEISRRRLQETQRPRVGRFGNLVPLYLQAGGYRYGGPAELLKDLIIR